MLAVGAVQEDGRKAYYADLGSAIGITAPGGTGTLAIYSIDNSGKTVPAADTYGLKAGTSFSSPLAAATASLMLAVNPALTPAQLVDAIKASARPHVALAGSSLISSIDIPADSPLLRNLPDIYKNTMNLRELA